MTLTPRPSAGELFSVIMPRLLNNKLKKAKQLLIPVKIHTTTCGPAAAEAAAFSCTKLKCMVYLYIVHLTAPVGRRRRKDGRTPCSLF